MSRTTKLELQQALSALGAEVEALRVEASTLREDNRILRITLDAANKELEAAALAAAAKPAPRVRTYVAPQPTAEQLAYRAAMVAARDLAIRTGRTVKVGA